jgi:hypothetical protein
MTWTYDVTALQTNTTYQVRYLIGDTLSTDPQLQDEEIAFSLTQRSSIHGAAAVCCRALANKFARSADQQAGDTRVAYSQISKAYAAKAIQLDVIAASGSTTPYAGGISITDLNNRQLDSDRVPPQFNIGMTDSALPVPAVGNAPDGGTGVDPGIRP